MNKLISSNITENSRSPYIIFMGLAISVIITLLSILAFAFIITYTDFPEANVAPIIIAVTALSILVGTSIASIKLNKNGLINGGIIGLLYMMCLYLLSSSLGTGFSLNSNAIIMVALGIIAGAIGRYCRSKYKKIKEYKIRQALSA